MYYYNIIIFIFYLWIVIIYLYLLSFTVPLNNIAWISDVRCNCGKISRTANIQLNKIRIYEGTNGAWTRLKKML